MHLNGKLMRIRGKLRFERQGRCELVAAIGEGNPNYEGRFSSVWVNPLQRASLPLSYIQVGTLCISMSVPMLLFLRYLYATQFTNQ